MTVVVVAEFEAEDVAVVVAVAHCHVSWVDDESSDPKNQSHDRSQCSRQLAMFVEVQKVKTEHGTRYIPLRRPWIPCSCFSSQFSSNLLN